MNMPDISEEMKTAKAIQGMIVRAIKKSSPDIAKYVCNQVAETMMPIYRMLGELSEKIDRIESSIQKTETELRTKIEDHERRIKALEKRIA